VLRGEAMSRILPPTPIHRRITLLGGARHERVFVRCPNGGEWEPLERCKRCGSCSHLSMPERAEDWLLLCEPQPTRRPKPAEAPSVTVAIEPSVLCVERNVPVHTIARAMRDEGHELAIVVDDEDRPTGIIAPADLAQGSTARAVMTPFATTLLEGAPLDAALELATQGTLTHVPILSAGRVMGLTSPRSLLAWLSKQSARNACAFAARPASPSPRDADSTRDSAGPLLASSPPMSRHPARRAISEFMTPSPHSIGAEQSLDTAHRMMRSHAIRHLPVLEAGKLVGLLSQRDLYLIEALDKLDTTNVRVDEAMSQDTYVVGPTAPLEEVARVMADKKIGCAVVIDHAKIVGVFTTIDALRALADLLRGKESAVHP
jgi:acetoin utilization protein AcuB